MLSEELALWLVFNDAEVSCVGGWADVVATAVAQQLQPSVLFFEAQE